MMSAAKLGYTVNGRQLLDAEDALWSTQLNSFAYVQTTPAVPRSTGECSRYDTVSSQSGGVWFKRP